MDTQLVGCGIEGASSTTFYGTNDRNLYRVYM